MPNLTGLWNNQYVITTDPAFIITKIPKISPTTSCGREKMMMLPYL